MYSKVLTLLGFAAKAGKLCYGMDMSVAGIKSKKAAAVFTAADVSAKSKKEISFFANKQGVPVIANHNINKQQLSGAIGKQCGIVSVNDSGFASAIIAELQGKS